ncbi:hypothetical protein BJ875DRAFT_439314 [Amylocarpus encephaloides]|uniref:Uncharacterized protein n=1 Tax=Amylocarpus encephaloides TaxID=45428 RepID=A0A9P7YNM4_9HELO|nr:hypothetical protein BJ875DRAFT_439314 [Amylocarpus encephaloides]
MSVSERGRIIGIFFAVVFIVLIHLNSGPEGSRGGDQNPAGTNSRINVGDWIALQQRVASTERANGEERGRQEGSCGVTPLPAREGVVVRSAASPTVSQTPSNPSPSKNDSGSTTQINSPIVSQLPIQEESSIKSTPAQLSPSSAPLN